MSEIMQPSPTTDFDSRSLRRAFGHFPTGVVALCAMVGDSREGLVASTFVPVSLDPPLVSVCVQNTSTTWPRLKTAATLGISVLGEEHDTTARMLAAKTNDRFDSVSTTTNATGSVLIAGTPMRLSARIVEELPAGDHVIVVLGVEEVALADDVLPMIFHRSVFQRLRAEAR